VLKWVFIWLGLGVGGAYADGEMPEFPFAVPRAARPAGYPVLDRCRLFNAFEFVPKNWSHVATGVRFFNGHPAFAKLTAENYRDNPFTIVDTGLKLSENPLGPASEHPSTILSAELDVTGHGTTVFGTVTGTFGLDPLIHAELLRVREGKSSDGGANSTIDSVDLKAKLFEAIFDPRRRVINVSVELVHGLHFVDVFDAARTQKKILTIAGGNQGRLGVNWKKGDPQVEDNPYLFAVGGSSYLGAPYSVSTTGEGIDIYVPAVDIQTLNPRYSEFRRVIEPSVKRTGTSFAAPILGAVIHKLLLAFPKLSGTAIKMAVKQSAITTGVSKNFPTLNLPLLISLVERAYPCAEALPDEALEATHRCFVDAKNALASPAVPARPTGDDCRSWEEYWERLQKGFFHSGGDDPHRQAMGDFLAAAGAVNRAEWFWFTPRPRNNRETARAVERLSSVITERPSYSQEIKIARDYYEGGFDSRLENEGFNWKLTRLLAQGRVNEAVDFYLDRCRKHFFTEEIPFCRDYLHRSTKVFDDGLILALSNESQKLIPSQLSALFYWPKITTVDFSPLVVTLAQRCAEAPENCTYSYLFIKSFARLSGVQVRQISQSLAQSLTKLETRKAQPDAVIQVALSTAHKYSLAWLRRPLSAEEERGARAAFMGVNDWGGKLDFALARYRVGQIDLVNFKQWVSEAIPTGTSTPEFIPFQNFSISVGSENPQLAEAIADIWLANQTALSRGVNIVPAPPMPDYIPWISKLSDEKATAVLDLILFKCVSAGQHYGDAVIDILKKGVRVPAVVRILSEIQRPQSDPKKRLVRLAWLKIGLRTVFRRNERVDAYLRESTESEIDKFFFLQPSVVANDPELYHRFEKVVLESPSKLTFVSTYNAKIDGDPQGTNAIFERLARPLFEHMDGAGREALFRLPLHFFSKGKENFIDCPVLVELAVEWLSGTDPLVKSHRESVLSSIILVSRLPQMQSYFGTHPDRVAKIADAIVNVGSIPLPNEWLMLEVSPTILAELRKHYPATADPNVELPEWIFQSISLDPDGLTAALALYRVTSGKNRARVCLALQRLLEQSSPARREFRRQPDADAIRKEIRATAFY